MYANDTAHAVHLSSLQFRPDGLLTAATRYPRTNGESWTAQESKEGWYTYDERVIDCETGFHVDTATSLLGRDGAKIATRAGDKAEQLSALEGRLRDPQHRKWPRRSDIFLACAAASNPDFKRQRAAYAAQVQPLFSSTSLIQTLGTQSDALFASASMRYDFSRLGKRPAASAAALFEDMRFQYAAWRRSFNAGKVVGAAAVGRSDIAVMAEANRQLKEAGSQGVSVKRINGALIEHTYPGTQARTDARGRPLTSGYAWIESARTDCAYGVSVPFAMQTFIRGGKPRPAIVLGAGDLMAEITQAYANEHAGAEGPFGGFSLDPSTAALCALLDQIRHARSEEVIAAAAEAEEQTGYPYGLTPGDLARDATPAAMLLAIRAARRAHGH